MPRPMRRAGGVGLLAVAFAIGALCAVREPWAAQGETERLRLLRGEFYFSAGKRHVFLFGRNAAGWRQEHFEELFAWAEQDGEKLARVQLTVGIVPQGPAGAVDERWAKRWEKVFQAAGERGIYILPVFGVWADWNDGSRGEPWQRWKDNPYNQRNGGPAEQPADLLRDTPCRRMWLSWLGRLVARWSGRSNILAWEIFSELDLVSGSNEELAAEFVEQAAQVVRNADPARRPITASLAGVRDWPAVFSSEAVDLVQVHPYASGAAARGELAELIIQAVRQRLARYGKPVLIGECGLEASGPTGALVASSRARVGIKHAIWASLVSGAANGRMLWWEDGYDRFFGLDLRSRYSFAARSAVRLAATIDFAGFRPLPLRGTAEIAGAAVGNERTILAWVRDVRCAAPRWPVRHLVGQRVSICPLGKAKRWVVQMYDTDSGALAAAASLARDGAELVVNLPPFEDSLAVVARSAGQ